MTVFAAGALCWRQLLGEPHVLVVHRDSHKDVSFPKGKQEKGKGECIPVTAVREVEEETGLHIVLGPYLGTVEYTLPSGTDKVVHYWASRIDDAEALQALGAFVPNDEITEVMWMSIPEARRKLSYAFDVELLDRLTALIDAGRADTFPVIVVRHGKALSRSRWGKAEHTRPLTDKGVQQSRALVPALAAWRPSVLLSSPWERCIRTLAPYAQAFDQQVATREKLTEVACAETDDRTRALVRHQVGKRRSLLMCSHRPVLPAIARGLQESVDNPEAIDVEEIEHLDPGSFAVLALAATSEGKLHVDSCQAVSPLSD